MGDTLRRKLRLDTFISDDLKNLQTLGIGLKVDILRVGGTVRVGGAIDNGIATDIDMYHPGRLAAGDKCYVYDDTLATMTAVEWTVNSITFTSGEWVVNVTPDDDSSLADGDQFVLVNALAGHRVTCYTDPLRGDTSTLPIDIGLADGVLETWVKEYDVDLAITLTAGTLKKYVRRVPTDGARMDVTPRLFGAPVNGSDDDHPGSQRCADYLASDDGPGRGAVYLDSGNWQLNTPVTFKGNNIGARGDGVGATSVVATTAAFAATSKLSPSVRGMAIGAGAGNAGISFTSCTDPDVDGVSVAGGSHGVAFTSCTRPHVDNMKLASQTTAGVFASACDGVVIGDRMVYLSQTGTACLLIQGDCDDVHIGAGALYAPTNGNCIRVEATGSAGELSGVHVAGGHCSGGDSDHVYCEGVAGLSIGPLHSAAPTGRSIKLEGCTEFELAKPICTLNATVAAVSIGESSGLSQESYNGVVALVVKTTDQDGLELLDATERVTISGSSIEAGSAADAVTAAATTSDCTITANVLKSGSGDVLSTVFLGSDHEIGHNNMV